MNKKKIEEYLILTQETIDLIPAQPRYPSDQTSKMFQHFHAIGVAFLDQADIRSELKDLIPANKLGEFYDAVRKIHDTSSFTFKKSAELKKAVNQIHSIIEDIKNTIDESEQEENTEQKPGSNNIVRQTNELEPKPPEILQNIVWLLRYGRKHKKKIIVAAVFLSLGGFAFVSKIPDLLLKSSSDQNVEKTEKEIKKNKNELKAPTVRFLDGTVKSVEMSVQMQLDKDLLVQSFSLYGSAEKAMSSLNTSVLGAAIAILETKTEDYVRKNRVKVANEIIEQTKDAQNRTAYKIIELSIGEIY